MQSYPSETPVWLDVEKVFNSKDPLPMYTYQGQVHTEEEDIDITNILSLDVNRDYVNKVGDVIWVKFQLPMKDYMKKFYPYRNNLELTLTRQDMLGGQFGADENKPETIERYKAVYIPNKNLNAEIDTVMTLDDHTLNNRPPVDVELQLLNRTLEPLRIKTISGVFSKLPREKFLRAVMAGETSRIMVDGKPGLDAMDIVKPHNEDDIQQLVLPSFTPVLSIPTYLQERHNGVYRNGIGSYFQTYNKRRTWFIYPLFIDSRYEDPVPKLVIYGTSNIEHAGMDRTYLVEDKIAHIVVTGDRKYTDDGETGMMEHGSGMRQAKANTIMDKPHTDDLEKGPIGTRKENMVEFVGAERDDGLQYAPRTNRGISNNVFAEASLISMRMGARIDLVWHNSNSDLLYPGMPVKYMYLDDKDIKELYGVLLFNHTTIAKGNDSTGIRQTDQMFTSNTMMTIWVGRYTDAT